MVRWTIFHSYFRPDVPIAELYRPIIAKWQALGLNVIQTEEGYPRFLCWHMGWTDQHHDGEIVDTIVMFEPGDKLPEAALPPDTEENRAIHLKKMDAMFEATERRNVD